MQLKRQSVDAWQNEKHYSKENNTSENPIPRRKIFKSVDHVKYEVFLKLFIRSKKMHHVELKSGTSK